MTSEYRTQMKPVAMRAVDEKRKGQRWRRKEGGGDGEEGMIELAREWSSE